MNRWAIFRIKSIALCLFLYMSCIGISAAAENDNKQPLDVRILIDISGSMKQNDPNNLRQPALELLIDLLPDNSKVGVWSFGTYVNMLVKPDSVDANWREQAKKQISNIHNLGQRTNLTQALKTSAYDFGFSTFKPDTHFILLTDGMVDVSRDPKQNQQARDDILQNILPNFVSKQAVIHTVALSDQADTSLLQQLSIQTQGVADTAYVADDLTPIFLKAFDRLVSQEQVSLVENNFLIDKSVEEFTALIFHEKDKSIQFKSPNAQIIAKDTTRNDVKWKSLATYDIITIEQPKFGQWEIVGQVDALSRVSVISDLSLNMTDMPNNLFSHQIPEFAAWLTGEYITGNTNSEQDSDRIMDESLLSLVDVTVMVEQQGDMIFKDQLNRELDEFQFNEEHILRQGEYKLTLNLKAPTFERTLIKNIMLRSAFSVESLGISKPEEFYLIRIYKNDRNIDSNSVMISGEVNGNTVDFVMTDHGYWEYKQFPMEGINTITMTVKASYKRGVLQNNDEKIANLTLNFPVNSLAPIVHSQSVEPVEENKQDKMPEPESMQSEDPAELQLGSPDMVLGFNKLVMPKIQLSDQKIEKMDPEPKDTETELNVEPSDPIDSIEDEWGDDIVIAVADDSLNALTILLSTLPLILILGGGFWIYKKLTSDLDEHESQEDYTPEEKAALESLENNESVDEVVVQNEQIDEIEIDDVELEKELTPLENETPIDVKEIDRFDKPDEPDLDIEAELDADLSIDIEDEESELDNQVIDEFAIDDPIDADLESDPVEDAIDEFEKQTSQMDDFDSDDPIGALDQAEEQALESLEQAIDDDPFEDMPLETSEDANEQELEEIIQDPGSDTSALDDLIDSDPDFDIDVDSLDSGGLDDMEFDQDDDPFENDKDPK
ncbi:VWA domain-containing protein [Marinicellulosiphila megalodicopiae]|uniref:VWA domain-containing protein n=1 Tax=Marinicellulosiphila megalodicopiae TaxID=2724896 RepID=UPI003BB1B695